MQLSQDILRNAHVMVVGCGALGNEVLKNLVLLGVENLCIVDMDKIERSNLTRSVFYRNEDVSMSKVSVMRRRLRELNPHLSITAIDGDIAHDVGLGLIRKMDVVIGCVDNRWARFMINRHCMRMQKMWVDGGINTTEGTVRVFGVGNCYACNLGTEGQKELRLRMPCANTIRRSEQAGHAPTNIVTASVVGAVMAQEAAKLICGEETIMGHMFCYDADAAEGRKVVLKAYDEECPEHEAWEDIVESNLTPDVSVCEFLTSTACETLILRDDCFVDYITDRRDNARYELMCPGRMVAEKLDAIPTLRGRNLSDFYQSEYHNISVTSPYSKLTLRQLGIPDGDVLIADGRYISLKEETTKKN